MQALLVLLIISLLPLPALAAETVRGMVRHVTDGDTVTIVSRSAGKLTVRLYGIDAPETGRRGQPGQPYGAVAKRVLMYKLLGKTVTVESKERDQYGRMVGIVTLHGKEVNAEMIAEGMAWAYRQYLQGPYASKYSALEEQARRHRRGLWRRPNPQPPWEFRHAGDSSQKKRRP